MFVKIAQHKRDKGTRADRNISDDVSHKGELRVTAAEAILSGFEETSPNDRDFGRLPTCLSSKRTAPWPVAQAEEEEVEVAEAEAEVNRVTREEARIILAMQNPPKKDSVQL